MNIIICCNNETSLNDFYFISEVSHDAYKSKEMKTSQNCVTTLRQKQRKLTTEE